VTQGMLIEVQAGPYLKRTVRFHVCEIFKAISKLAEALREKNSNRKIIAPLTGVVWECVDRLNGVKLEEKLAILDGINHTLLVVKDALTELEQLKANSEVDKDKNTTTSSSSSSSNQVNDDNDEEDDYDDLMDFDFDEGNNTLSTEDLEVLPGVIQLVKMSCFFITKVEGIIRMSSPDNFTTHALYTTWLDKLRNHVVDLSAAVDELSSSTYSPQVRSEVESNFETLRQSTLTAIPTLSENPITAKDNLNTLLQLVHTKMTSAQLITKE